MTEAPPPGVLMLDIQGPRLNPEDRLLLRRPVVGGVILFARNIVSRAQVAELVAELRDCNPALLLAVDQEGGRVQRLRDGFTRLPPLGKLGEWYERDAAGALSLARDSGWLMAAEVLATGLDFSFAPVLDLNLPISRIIGDRGFSADPDTVSALALAYVEGMHEAGMAATGKHFPGHGSVAADSHVEIPVDERSLARLQQSDLIPFTRCSQVLEGIMPAHVIYPAVDQACAGFSSRWLQDILRRKLGFDGVVFSDDLSMAAAHTVGSVEQRTAAALAAGCDMVLVCNDRPAAVAAAGWLEAQQTPGNHRLLRMRGRAGLTWAQLETQPRWLQTRQALQPLCQG